MKFDSKLNWLLVTALLHESDLRLSFSAFRGSYYLRVTETLM
jgi:hypothetical protein